MRVASFAKGSGVIAYARASPRKLLGHSLMERFFLSLKMERVWRRDYANHAEAIRDITEYIVGFYNNERLHSKLRYLPPTVYEREMASKSSFDHCSFPCCTVMKDQDLGEFPHVTSKPWPPSRSLYQSRHHEGSASC